MGSNHAFSLSARLSIYVDAKQVRQQINKALNFGGSSNLATNHLSPVQQQAAALQAKLAQTTAAAQKASVAVRGVAKSFGSASSAASAFGNSAGSALRRFAGFSVVAGTLLAVAGGLRSGVKESIQFQHGMVRLGTITGKTTAELSGLRSHIEGLGTSLGVSNKELLGVTDTLTQAGLSARETQQALSTLAKTSLAPTFGDMRTSAEGAIAVMGQFRSGVGDLEKQFGSMNRVAAKFAVESNDLIEVVRKSGGVYSQAGGSLSELLALFTAVRSKTRESASSIATGLKTIFTSLGDESRLRKLESLLNVRLTQGGRALDPFKQIGTLSAALKDEPTGSLLQSEVVKTLGGVRQAGKVIPLLKEYRTAVEALKVAQEGENSLAEDAARAQESLLVQLERVKNEYSALFNKLVDTDTFRNTTRAIMGLATSFAHLADTLMPLLPAMQALAAIKIGGAIMRAAPSFGRRVMGHASGGLIPGSGSGDTHPAMLEPGEFVVRKRAVQAIGVGNLNRLNSIKGYRHGGLVGAADDSYGFHGEGMSQKVADLIHVIEQDIRQRQQDLADRKAARTGSYSLSPTASPSAMSAARRKAAVANMLTIPMSGRADVYSSAAARPWGFDDIVADALNGPSATSPADAYSLASPARQRKASLGRGHSRAAREAAINARLRLTHREVLDDGTVRQYGDVGGYGSLLGRIRRPHLQAMSDSALSERGIASLSQPYFPTFSRIAARQGRIARVIAGGHGGMLKGMGGRSLRALHHVGGNLGRYGAAAAFIGSAYAPQAAEAAFGQTAGNFVGHTTQSAVVGGSIGSLAGPWGIALGAATGAATGLVSAFHQMEKEARQAKLGTALTELGNAADQFSQLLEKGIGNQASGKVVGTLNTLSARRSAAFANIDEEALGKVTEAESAGLGANRLIDRVFNGGHYYRNLSRKAQADAERQKIEMMGGDEGHYQTLLEQAIARPNRTGSVLDTVEGKRALQFRAELGTRREKAAIMEKGGDVDQSAWDTIYKRNLEEQRAVIEGLDRDSSARRANLAVIQSFDNVLQKQTIGLQQFAQALSDLEIGNERANNLNNLNLGSTGSGPAAIQLSSLQKSLGSFGTRNLGGVASYLGRLSPAISQQATSVTLGNQLHAALTNGFGLSGFGDMNELRSAMGSQLTQNGIGRNSQLYDQVFRKLDEIEERNDGSKNDLLSGKGMQGFADDLLKPFESMRESLEKVAAGVDQQGTRLVDSFGHLSQIANSIGEQRDTSRELAYSAVRYRAGRMADKFGGDVTSYLGVGAGQSSFLQSQQRLTGLSGMDAVDPSKIASRAIANREQMAAASNALHENPMDAGAASALRTFESAAQNCVKALHELSDSSKLNASLQERLAVLDRDKEGRLGLAEKMTLGGHRERAELEHGARAVIKARAKGLDSLSDREKQHAFGLLDSASDVRLFGGESTGSDIKRQLLSNSRFGKLFSQTKNDAAEAEGLHGQVIGNMDKATSASDALATVLEHQQSSFFSTLSANQRTFLETLGGALGHDVKMPMPAVPIGPPPAMAGMPMSAAPVAGVVSNPIPGGPAAPGKPLSGDARRQAMAKLSNLRNLVGQHASFGLPTNALVDEISKTKLSLGTGRQLPGRVDRRKAYQDQQAIRKAAYQQNRQGRQDAFDSKHTDRSGQTFLEAANRLAAPIERFDKAVAKIPHSIDFQGSVKHEFIFNGAETLAAIMPSLQKLVEQKARDIVDAKLKKNFPDAHIS
ncbi:MAG TPA: phage tail tape measure protein [Pirellulales bacterium]|nr:phage tail tape measure protein [Pirellulales bacterium]